MVCNHYLPSSLPICKLFGTPFSASELHHAKTALHCAAIRGHAAVLKSLLSRVKSPDAYDNKSKTPLMMAAVNGHLGIVQGLLKIGASVDAADDHGRTALVRAAVLGKVEVVKALLDAGANARMRDCDARSVVHHCAILGKHEALKCILDKLGQDNTEVCQEEDTMGLVLDNHSIETGVSISVMLQFFSVALGCHQKRR